ncbi:MAG: thiol-disulfide oxidoreductase DCC family protein [Bacteriovoracaceae bacterium]
MKELNPANPKRVIFFDGLCGLCNGFVNFILKIDRNNNFIFSPLQSEFAIQTLPQELTHDLKTIVVLIDGQTFKKAQAVFAVFNEIGGIWKMISLLKILPNFLLDFVYDLVASNRYQFFGKKDSCRLPTPEERKRFII